MIEEFNKIDPENDTKEVIQSKIDALSKGLQEGTVTPEEYAAERERVEGYFVQNPSKLLGYAFTWLR